MTISAAMSLDPILARMGHQAATLREAELMRQVLNEAHAGQEIDDLDETTWLGLVGQMEQLKLASDPGMK
ncbi:hypothetical protein GO986_05165 [Deinococcus sp. HMF7620]|uniref:Uncharacterized protein n=1 Tax=Deinococcus arboris TaxID=2682977 RepID=A0A7C9HQG6_9DEIO|nr:hypothetical protein [Deinococcus arboris]MVN86149.1 hypothetical protein [Deinococcus arboris]